GGNGQVGNGNRGRRVCPLFRMTRNPVILKVLLSEGCALNPRKVSLRKQEFSTHVHLECGVAGMGWKPMVRPDVARTTGFQPVRATSCREQPRVRQMQIQLLFRCAGWLRTTLLQKQDFR